MSSSRAKGLTYATILPYIYIYIHTHTHTHTRQNSCVCSIKRCSHFRVYADTNLHGGNALSLAVWFLPFLVTDVTFVVKQSITNCWILKTKAQQFSESSGNTRTTIQQHIPEDLSFQMSVLLWWAFCIMWEEELGFTSISLFASHRCRSLM